MVFLNFLSYVSHLHWLSSLLLELEEDLIVVVLILLRPLQLEVVVLLVAVDDFPVKVSAILDLLDMCLGTLEHLDNLSVGEFSRHQVLIEVDELNATHLAKFKDNGSLFVFVDLQPVQVYVFGSAKCVSGLSQAYLKNPIY